MGKLVVSEFVTLDGVFQDPGGQGEFERGGWTFQVERGAEGMQFKFDELMAADALLLGRITYDGFAKAWPTMQGTGEFGAKMNAMPKFVVSTTLEQADWNNSEIIRANVPDEVSALKQRFAGDILVNGSGNLVQTLLEHNLVDEYRLMLYPFLLGAGNRLFHDSSASTKLRLVDTKRDGDCLILTYQTTATTGAAA
jgi:dihydrofolate reductase